MNDPQAMAQRYARRAVGDRYSPLRPEVWLALQERQRVMLQSLARHVQRPLAQLDVLEVGCGAGGNLLELLRLGFDPARLVGNELLPDRAAQARHVLPAATRVWQGDALALGLQPASFDLVWQSTVFSSLLDDAFQQQLAAAMWRWVRPGGAVMWYDFVYNNPRNPDVRGVPLARVQALFPQGQLEVRRVTLAPPLARRLAPVHPALHQLAHALPWLRTHVWVWISKPAAPWPPSV